MPAAVVGSLRVLMSADSAQIVSDLGKARRAVGETRQDFALFGRSGVDAKRVLFDLGGASRENAKAVKEVSRSVAGAMETVSTEGQTAVLILNKVAASGFHPLGIAAAVAAVTIEQFATKATAAIENADKAFEEHGKAVTERWVATRRLRAEKFDFAAETNLAPLVEAQVRVEEAQKAVEAARRKAAQAQKDSIVGIDSLEAATAALRANDVLDKAMADRTKILQDADIAQAKAVRDIRRHLEELAEARAEEERLSGFTGSSRRAEEQVAALRKKLSEDTKATGLSPEVARDAVEKGLLDQKRATELVSERAAAEKRAAAALKEQSDYLRGRAAEEDLKPWRDRVDAAEKLLDLLRQGRDPQSQEVKSAAELAKLLKEEAASYGDSYEVAHRKVGVARLALDLEQRIAKVLREQAAQKEAADAADSMRRQTDLDAIRNDPRRTDRNKAIDEAGYEFGAKLIDLDKKGLPHDAPERERLIQAWRRREAEINAEFDSKRLDAQKEFAAHVGEVQRASTEQSLAGDRNETSLRLAEEDRRHAAEIQKLDEALHRFDLTEEQGIQHRQALEAAHAQMRATIEAQGREKEIAWLADYNRRVLALETEGETDQLRVISLGTDQRLAALAEGTRREVEELRRRGDEARAQEIENAAAAARARIQTQARQATEDEEKRRRADTLSKAVTGNELGEGFQGRVSQLREETAGWGRLGAQMADVATNDLSGGVASALESIARGSKTAGEAFREFAADFAFQVARMIEQALIMKAIL
ncbi:MAG: hypothetical protein K8T90_01755, partial [Planctomycetes bacterium]|nr:hypothetical protein [Planctomycetota bacterium]